MEIRKLKGFASIDVKRWYSPYLLISKCAQCGHRNELDLTDDYLSYPSIDEPHEVYFFCDKCEHEYEEKIVIKMEIVPYMEKV